MPSNKQYLLNIYQAKNPDMPLHECMREVNRWNSEPGDPAFAPVDVNFLEFMHDFKKTGTQREFDLVQVASFFHAAYGTLRAEVVGVDKMSVRDKDDVVRTYGALVRLGLPHLMEEGLPKKWVKWLKAEFTNAHSPMAATASPGSPQP